MTSDNFFKKKIATLLHDPPSKPWIVSGIRGVSGGHEEEAKSIATEIFGEEISELLNDTDVRQSDRLAASFDRWVLSFLLGGEYNYQAFATREVKLYNLFYRDRPYEVPLEPPTNIFEQRLNFITNIKRIHEHVLPKEKWRLAYYTFYALYEYVWCKYFGTPGPADTRIPTHTVFDHTYATASTLNIVGNGRIDGYMVAIDLGGVQKFIAASRKMRDMWASSWLTSSLAWSIILPFIENFGPDILILPTARGNPFFYHTLLCMLKKHKIWDKIEDIPDDLKKAAELAGYDIQIGYPSHAVVPATITLILPSTTSHPEEAELLHDGERIELSDAKRIAEFVNNLYISKWSKLIEKILNIINKETELQFLSQVFKDLAVYDSPPLPLRVAVAEIKSEHLSRESYLLYHKAFQKISNAISEAGGLKFSPSATLKLTEYTKKYVEYTPAAGEIRFYACSVCGEVPAAPKSLEIAEVINSYEKNLITLEVMGERRTGERLCPYCLIKRLSTTKEIFPIILEVLLGKHILNKLPRFPSVSSVAAINFKKSILLAAIENPNKILPLLQEVVKERINLDELHLSHVEYFPEQELLKQIEQKIENNDDLIVLGTLAIGDAEDLLLIGEQRPAVTKLSQAVKEGLPSRSSGLNTYYALIKSDGDDIGKIVSGSIGHVGAIRTFNNVFTYLSNLTPNRDLGKVLYMIGDGRLEEAAKTLARELRREIKPDKILELLGLLESCLESEANYKDNWMKRFLVSPAYHASLSKALMMLAIQTSKELSKRQGFIVYSGGDDVLAVTTADAALDAALKVRKLYGGEPVAGFLKQSDTDEVFVQALGDLGQSFSIVYAHYRYPLSLVLNEAINALEHEAKEIKWSEHNLSWLSKDSLVVTYLPRGGNPVRSRLPFRCKQGEVGCHINGVLDIIAFIDKGLISSSLVKDLSEEMIRIGAVYSTGAVEIVHKIIEYVVKRNAKVEGQQIDKTKINKVLGKGLGYVWFYNHETLEERNQEFDQRLLIDELVKALQAELGARRSVES